MQIFLFFALFISVLAVIFAIQNNTPVTVSFVTWEFPGSLALVLLIALAAGALISFLFSLPSNLRTRWALRQQRKKIIEMESSLASIQKQLDDVYKKAGEEKIEVPAPLPAPFSPEPQPAAPAAVSDAETMGSDSEVDLPSSAAVE